MKKLLTVLGVMAFLVALVPSPPAEANCVVEVATTYTEGTSLKDTRCDTSGAQKVTLSGGGSSGSATAAAPSVAEGSQGYFSWDLSGNLRITFGTLLFGENSTYNLLETSGGVVRSTVMASAVTTNTTSTAVAVPIGTKRLYGSVDGTGAVTQTQAIYGGLTSGVTATNGELLCTLTLSGTTHDHAGCTVSTPHLFYIVVTTATTGTSATGVVTALY